MANPNVPQGTLNRLRGSVIFNSFPSLNITAPFLAKEAISITFEGDGSLLLPTMTGGVQSAEPYVFALVTANVLKSQGLSSAFKAQFETDTNMGDMSVITDSATLSDYDLVNSVMLGVSELTFDGNQAGFAVRFRAIYQINSGLWNS